MSRCHDYGIGRGCDIHCPVLLDGECTIPGEILQYLDDEDDIRDIKEMYNLGEFAIWKEVEF